MEINTASVLSLAMRRSCPFWAAQLRQSAALPFSPVFRRCDFCYHPCRENPSWRATGNRTRKRNGIKSVCRNKRAFHDYAILDTLECGIVLTDTEVKSLRSGSASLEDAYAKIQDGEVWLLGSDIPEYAMGNLLHMEPLEERNLLAQGIVFVPSPQITGGSLTGAAEIAANDIWAVGGIFTANAQQTLAEHFKGTSWSVVSSSPPDAGTEPAQRRRRGPGARDS